MNVLLLVIKHQIANLESYYEGIAQHATVDLRHLDNPQQKNLRQYFRQHVDLKKYDRIILFLRFKREIRQIPFLKTLPGLIILEHDACQNYLPHSKYQGKFSRHYQALPWARILVSGHQIAEKLKAEGFDAHFVPKPYDNKLLKNLHKERSIELGFIGSTESSVYTQRNRLLEKLKHRSSLQIMKTKPGQDYLNTLNTIKIFVGADIGFGEYMTKNFEAMACGCLLMTWNQGARENQALGFKDMHNVVLYQSEEEFTAKLQQLREHPELISSIAQRGQTLAETQHNCNIIGRNVIEAIKPPLRQAKDFPRKLNLRYYFYR